VCVSESQFADDLALYTVNLCLNQLEGNLFRWEVSLTVSIPKTKGLVMGAVSEDDVFPVEVD